MTAPTTADLLDLLAAIDLRERLTNAAPLRPMRVGLDADLTAQHIAAETNPDFARAGIRRWRKTVEWHRPDDDDPSVCSRCTRSEGGVVSGGYYWPCPDLTDTADEARAYLAAGVHSRRRLRPDPAHPEDTMTADLLRRAATEMRERAAEVPFFDEGVRDAEESGEPWPEHCSAWTPAVALAVADLLDEEAQGHENALFDASHLAIAVARAYLGETS